jgi:hypothetical protein
MSDVSGTYDGKYMGTWVACSFSSPQMYAVLNNSVQCIVSIIRDKRIKFAVRIAWI